MATTETPLEVHVKHDAEYWAEMDKRISRLEGKHMEGLNSDKVNINVGDGGGGGGGMAAIIAALGNRNQGNDNAALIAALGNRNDDSNSWGPMLAAMGGGLNRNDGMNNLWPIILLALLGRGRGGGGLFGGGDDCGGGGGGAALLQTLMEGQSNLRAEVPTTALQTQNAVQGAIASLALGTQQGFSNVKDSVQTASAFLDRDIQMANQNVSAQGCQTREVVQNDGDKTRGLLVSRFQQEDATKIANLNAEVVELRNESRRRADHDELRIQISNQNTASSTQNQAQGQFQVQSQINELSGLVRNLAGIVAIGNQTMLARQAQDIVNLGTMTASGTQAAANTQVR